MKFKTKDPDLIAFVKAAGITGGTEFSALNYLVLALKNNNLWNRIHALYPFVGGTATTHKFNLKNPVDTNAAFRLQFNGSVIHDSNGVTFSSINGWANTFLIPTTTITLNKETLALYSRSSFSGLSAGVDMGAAVSVTARDELVLRNNINIAQANINTTTSGSTSFTNTDATGFYFATRQTSTDLRIYKNGVLQSSGTTLNNGSRSNIAIYLGARNVSNAAQGFTGRNFTFALIGLDFTPAESATWYQIVQQYNFMLNRHV